MRFPTTVCILVLASVAYLFMIDVVDARPKVCQPECTDNRCADRLVYCKYGIRTNHLCKYDECLRGPGELCGGPFGVYGECASNMWCAQTESAQTVCHGCTGERECYNPIDK